VFNLWLNLLQIFRGRAPLLVPETAVE